MSKASKTKSKIMRLRFKKARKAQQQARYEEYKRQGTNSKSFRFKKKAKGKSIVLGIHPDGKCGNPGCNECFEIKFRPFLKKGKPFRMPHWMWLRWPA